MKKRIILCALVMVLFFSLDVSAASKFKDVKETAWYYQYLKPLVDDKIIDGMPDGTFKPQNTLNADQLLKLMVTTVNPHASYERQLGVKTVNGQEKFEFLGTWFEPYLNVLMSMNIVQAEETVHKENGKEWKEADNTRAAYYNKPITREEVAYWIEKGFSFLRYKSEEYDEKTSESVPNSEIRAQISKWYKDADQIDDKYLRAIYIMHETGIMTGGDDGGFWPKKVLTRAEVTAVIYRLQKARYKEMGNNNLDFRTETARVDYVLRTAEDGKSQYWEKVVIKNGYVYSQDGMGETDKAEGIGIEQVSKKEIDLTDFPLVDGDDTPEWGEDEKGWSDEFKNEVSQKADMD